MMQDRGVLAEVDAASSAHLSHPLMEFGARVRCEDFADAAEDFSPSDYFVAASVEHKRYTLSCLCEALLRNESPHPEHLSAETLERFREGVSACRRSHYYQLAKGLSVAGILGRPLSIAPPREPTIRDDIGSGVASEWREWVERWTQTSTLETRSHIRCLRPCASRRGAPAVEDFGDAVHRDPDPPRSSRARRESSRSIAPGWMDWRVMTCSLNPQPLPGLRPAACRALRRNGASWRRTPTPGHPRRDGRRPRSPGWR